MGYYSGKLMGQIATLSNQAEVDSYISGLTTPLSSTQIGKLNTFVNSIKTGMGLTNLSDAFDVMYILAGETQESSLRNLVKRQHDGSKGLLITYQQYEGFTGASAISSLDRRIDLNYNVVSDAVTLLKDSSSMGFYSRTSGSGATQQEMGASGTSPYFTMQVAFNGSKCYVEMSNNIGTGFPNTSRLGFFSASRTNTNNYKVYKNGSVLGIENVASQNLINSKLYLLGGAVGYSSDIQMAFAFAGRGLTDAEMITLTNAIETYMDSNGKGVI